MVMSYPNTVKAATIFKNNMEERGKMKRYFVYKLGVLSLLAIMAFAGNTYAMMSSGGGTGTTGGTGGRVCPQG